MECTECVWDLDNRFLCLIFENMIYFHLEVYMENQINVGDQNTKMIDQSQANQPIQLPEKPKINYRMISMFILSVVVVILVGYYIVNFQKSKEYVKETVTPTPSAIPTQTASQTPIPSTISQSEKNIVFLGIFNNQVLLKYNGKIYDDTDQYDLKIVSVDSNSVNWMKVVEGPINPRGYNEPFSFKVFPGNKKAVIVMRWSRGDNDPETVSEYAVYKVFIYDIANQKVKEIKEMGQSANEKLYLVPKVDQISDDGQFISFNMFNCWDCGLHKNPETLLYSLVQDKTKRIGKVLNFKWLTGGTYRYKEYKVKPCAEPQSSECFEDPATLPYITDSF